jgi:MYXO-CTERM domain-containing protein
MLLCLTFALADTGDNQAPHADAGLGLIAYVGDVVVLNGAASSDPEGAELSFAWSQSGGPEVELKKASTVEPEFEVVASGTLRFDLVVNDGVADSEPDTVEVVVAERAFGGDPEGGCSTGGGAAPVGVAGVAAALVLRRRR